ncbi:putative lipoprotein [Flammeovirgaceae bacterium 311]|nr:putative lipoprotein [Flammeovirgaceae bacterium 311]
MKHLILSILVLLSSTTYAVAGKCFTDKPATEPISQSLPRFEKLQVGPLVNVVLQEGETEHIRIEYEGVSPEKINYFVKGNKLSIYLDDAKFTVKSEEVVKDGHSQKLPVYRDVKITAYVTYTNLKSIQISGEETLSCDDALSSKKFRIRQFGETRVELASLETGRLKVQSFGENRLTIRNGVSNVQSYRLFGENRINTENMAGYKISTSMFGESSLNVYASDEISLWAFGEVKMQYSGDPQLNRFVLGVSSINKR